MSASQFNARLTVIVGGVVLVAFAHTAAAHPLPAVPDELLVQTHAAVRREAQGELAADGTFTVGEIPALGVRVIRTPPGAATSVRRRLRASRLFRFVEPNYQVAMRATPNDPYYSQQWGLPITHVPAAWDTTRGDGVVIAVVDTGIDGSHPDLAMNMLSGFNVLTGGADATDDNGHGTRIAGIAAATGFNGIGVIGVAPGARLMPVKVLNASGTGTYADLAAGIVYAADHGARVINLSLGGEIDSQTLSSAVAYAESKGLVIAAAAGNDGTAAINYPAAYPGVIAVGASDPQDAVASFSNYGSWLGLVAPGVDILTTNLGGGYADSTGTSPATPFVSGAAALVLAANPQLGPQVVRSILTMTSDDLGAPGFDDTFGWGRLDVAAAVTQATDLTGLTSTLPPAIQVTSPSDGATVQGSVPLGIIADNSTPIARVQYTFDGAVVAAASNAPFGASWTPTDVSPGPHVLSATAYDLSGQRGTTAPVTVVVAGTQPSCGSGGGVCLPGGGAHRTDCFAEWLVAGANGTAPMHRRNTVLCNDGSGCDADGKADGVCTFSLGVCFATGQVVTTGTRSRCDPTDLDQFTLLAPGPLSSLTGAANLVSGVAALGSGRGTGVCIQGTFGQSCAQDADCDSGPATSDGRCALQSASVANVSANDCTALQSVRVPLRQGRSGFRAGRLLLKAATTGTLTGSQRLFTDIDRLRLVCLPPVS